MSNTPPTKPTTSELAEILFCCGLQESDRPTPEQVRTAIDARLGAGSDPSAFLAVVAQEAGDHPETYLRRMRWALSTVSAAYQDDVDTAA